MPKRIPRNVDMISADKDSSIVAGSFCIISSPTGMLFCSE